MSNINEIVTKINQYNTLKDYLVDVQKITQIEYYNPDKYLSLLQQIDRNNHNNSLIDNGIGILEFYKEKLMPELEQFVIGKMNEIKVELENTKIELE